MAARDITEHFAQKALALTAAEALRKNHEIQQKTIISLFRLSVPTRSISARRTNSGHPVVLAGDYNVVPTE